MAARRCFESVSSLLPPAADQKHGSDQQHRNDCRKDGAFPPRCWRSKRQSVGIFQSGLVLHNLNVPIRPFIRQLFICHDLCSLGNLRKNCVDNPVDFSGIRTELCNFDVDLILYYGSIVSSLYRFNNGSPWNGCQVREFGAESACLDRGRQSRLKKVGPKIAKSLMPLERRTIVTCGL